LDRIDCHLEIQSVEIEDLQNSAPEGETSKVIQARVSQVRQRQFRRQGCLNAELSAKKLQEYVQLDDVAKAFMKQAMEELGLSARAYHRLLRVALTIADMAGETISLPHLAEALSYRQAQRLMDSMNS
jgi:magnesium chelatase family protein